jgi:hypothetical protein
MAKKKIKAGIYPKKLVILPIIVGVIVIIGIAAIANKQKFTRHSVLQTSSTPASGQQDPVDTENDGVYINYQYGFKFRYPRDIFTYYSPITNHNVVMGANFNDDKDGNSGIYDLNDFTNYPWNNLEYFQRYDKIQVNAFEYSEKFLEEERQKGITHDRNTMKVRNIEIDGVRGYLLLENYLSGETEPRNSHSFSLLKNGKVITIQISSPSGLNSDPYKNQRLKILNGIIDTFEFITLTSEP